MKSIFLNLKKEESFFKILLKTWNQEKERQIYGVICVTYQKQRA